MKRLLLMAVLAVFVWLLVVLRPPKPGSPDKEFANRESIIPEQGRVKKGGGPKENGPSETNELKQAGQLSEGIWAESLDQILRAENSESEKAIALLEAMPGLKQDDQIETARHLVNLLSDEEFWLAGGYLTNAGTFAEVSEIFYHDLFLRPDTVKLPLLLEVAKTPNQPLAGQALEALAGHFFEDHQTNWAKWSEAIQARLQAE